jgi:hypothetical protein
MGNDPPAIKAAQVIDKLKDFPIAGGRPGVAPALSAGHDDLACSWLNFEHRGSNIFKGYG